MTIETRSRVSLCAFILAFGLVGASCSSDEPNAAESQRTSAPTTSAPTPASDDGAVPDTEFGFDLPEGRLDELASAGLSFVPGPYPSQPDGVDWPTSQWPRAALPADVDASAVESLVDRAFGELTDDAGSIDSIVVIKDGSVVVEEYNDWEPTKAHNSWSMAKSINSALVGILVGQGKLDISSPVEASEWRAPDDPRSEITLDQLLRMSSGLEWDESYTDPEADVLKTLGTQEDRGAYAANKQLIHEPGTVWYYSTGTANLIARTVAAQVGTGDELTSWIDAELFDKLGIATAVHSIDAAGVISGGSFIDMAPLDFARFGLLYARDGIWDGERILPKGWVDYSRMPTPSDPEGRYGAQWWLVPENPNVFYASGFNGQSISVVPDADLVVVVLSTAGDGRDDEIKNGLLAAFGASR